MPRRLLAPALAALLCACASGAPGTGPSATARLLPVRGPGAQGSVDLLQAEGVLRVFGTVRGLAPNAQYLLRVRDADGCAAPGEGRTAPPGAAPAHAASADRLPNLHADATGTATFSFDVRALSLDGTAGVLGRGLEVLAQPEGPGDAAGRRLACGTIRPR
jgi:Cu/Zn superoxide dismutase